MTSKQDNPCLTCSIHQDCCTNLHGLKLTRNEYEAHFRQHADVLSVSQDGGIVTVSKKNGGACPNWKSDGCGVYLERPVECRLFPFTMDRVDLKKNEVIIGFHSDVNCPQKEKLLMPEPEAHALMRRFATEAFGEVPAVRAYRMRRGGLFEKLTSWLAARRAREI
jgi:Fe-S-cluster containining protein